MIYQVKGISGHQWVCVGCVHVCAGVHGCARVCAGVHGCLQVCASVRGYARVCVGMRECARVYTGVCGCAQVCAGVCVDMHGCTHVCGMNFQNFFWRIESLHQRTLIRILYEFFYVISGFLEILEIFTFEKAI